MGNSQMKKKKKKKDLTLILVQVKPRGINLKSIMQKNWQYVKPDKLDRARAKMANTVVIKNYFHTLEKVLKESNLMNKPDNIFNVDESGLNLELRKGIAVISRSLKHAYS